MPARVASTASAALVSAESTVRAMPAAAASIRLPAASLMLSIRARCAERRWAAPPATSSTSRARSARRTISAESAARRVVGVAPGLAQDRGERVDLRLDARQIGDQHAHIGKGGGSGWIRAVRTGVRAPASRCASSRRFRPAAAPNPRRARAVAGHVRLTALRLSSIARRAGRPSRRARRLAAHRGGGAAEAARLAPAGALEQQIDDAEQRQRPARQRDAGGELRHRRRLRLERGDDRGQPQQAEHARARCAPIRSLAAARQRAPARPRGGGAAAAAPRPARRVEWLRAARDARATARSIVPPCSCRGVYHVCPSAEGAARATVSLTIGCHDRAMSYDPGALHAALAAAVGDDPRAGRRSARRLHRQRRVAGRSARGGRAAMPTGGRRRGGCTGWRRASARSS